MDIDVISAVMRLFKGWDITVDQNQDEYDRQQVEQLLYESLIAADLRDYAISETTTNAAISIWGINIENLTGTFHKSFSTVENTDYMTLIYQQLLHYFTTYGAELFGSYDREAVFIPTEVSEIPEIIQGMKLTVIRPFDPAEIRERITTLAHQNMGLSDKVLYDLAILYKHYLPNTTEVEISNLPNRELKIRLYDTLELIPYEADEFLRYCIFLATGKTLLIKNRNVIELLKAWANSATGAAYILRATKELDRRILAQSYHRYHEYWLSMKQIKAATDEDKAINAFINKVSKLADKHHRPLSHNVLQNVCDATITLEDIERAVQEASDAQLMKTWEYLLFIRSFTYSIATTSEIDLPRNYMIRNGSVWTKVTSMQSIETLQQRIEPIQAELQKRFAHLAGKSFYIPSNVAYPLYTSGKKTVGVLPHGTVLSIHFNESEPESSDNNIIVAIHWFDAGDTGDANERVDLD
ncbi:MAG: hypothetical protein FWD45_07340, partial [Coriobacteriia bacterium]|nr:hypothetical protein [Coriobacteriia bacterium]